MDLRLNTHHEQNSVTDTVQVGFLNYVLFSVEARKKREDIVEQIIVWCVSDADDELMFVL